MAITLTTSQRTAIADAAVEPRTLVEFHTQHGIYYFAQERVIWSGKQYQPRLTAPVAIAEGLGGVQGFGITPPTRTTISIANPDGWISTQGPAFYRYGDVIVKEVVLSVESDAIRTYRLIATGGQMGQDGKQFTITAEDFLSPYRQRVFPSNNCILTDNRFPNIQDNALDPNHRENTPMTTVFGRAMTKLVMIEPHLTGQESGGLYWLVGYGSLTIPPSGQLFQFPVSPTIRDFQLYTTASWGLRYLKTYDGIPYTAVFVYPEGGNPGDDAQQTYLDTRGGFYGYPDEVLLFMLTNSQVGVGLDASLIDSVSLQSARSWYAANDFTMDFNTHTQKTLDTWLSEWSRDSLTRLIIRDKIYLSLQTSRNPVASFHNGNVMKDSMTFTDAQIGQEQSRVAIQFRDRTKDEGWVNTIRYNVGSGADYTFTSQLIGRPTVASKVSQTIAKRAVSGIRTYQFQSTIRHTALDPGDLVSVRHAAVVSSNTQPIWCEIEAVRRSGGRIAFTAREIGSRTFQFGNVVADGGGVVEVGCPKVSAVIWSPYSWGDISSGVNDTMVLSHNLGLPPIGIGYRYSTGAGLARGFNAYVYNTTFPWSLDLTTSWAVYHTGATCPVRVTFPVSGYTSLVGSLIAAGGVVFVLTSGLDCVPDPPPV